MQSCSSKPLHCHFGILSIKFLLIANFMALRADDSLGWSVSLHFKSDRIAAKQDRVGVLRTSVELLNGPNKLIKSLRLCHSQGESSR